MVSLKDKLVIAIPLILTSLHFFRIGSYGYFLIYITTGMLLFSNLSIRFILSTALLIISFFLWIKISYELVLFRITFHMDMIRLIFILSSIILLVFFAILYSFYKIPIKEEIKTHRFSIIIFVIIFVLIMFLRTKITSIKTLLLDRFGLYMGDFESFLLALYGSYIGEKFKNPLNHMKMRKKVWLLFSLVFFSQLFLGLFLNKQFLMTGKLHFPIPALIIGGPIYRGKGFFMIGLFLSTILMVGPAWCSHLCYVGGLDSYFSSLKPPSKIKLKRHMAWLNLFLTILLAILFRFMHTEHNIIIYVVSIFGIISMVLIFILSPMKNKMTHCISWCPLGLVSCMLGKINPFRIKIDEEGCRSCKACYLACPYQAIDFTKKAKINFYCTMCGDCIAICPHKVIYTSFLGKNKKIVYDFYIFLLVVLHTLFLGFARI